jgi:hypothetical protein
MQPRLFAQVACRSHAGLVTVNSLSYLGAADVDNEIKAPMAGRIRHEGP